MKPSTHYAKGVLAVALSLAALFFIRSPIAASQNQARRLILKDGSYQLVTKYETKGDRVRYLSAERGEWEEIPKDLIDWDATEKFEQGRLQGAPSPEAIQLEKEFEAEQKADEESAPQVSPGLRLPSDGGIFLLDTFENRPQLDELPQSGGELNSHTKKNILRSTINPLGGVKQTIELPGPRAKIQSHTTVPSIYINIDGGKAAIGSGGSATDDPPPLPPVERFKIVRAEIKGGKRIAGAIKIAPRGKVTADERFVSTTAAPMIGGWIKITPKDSLPIGEYAVVEMLGKEGMNLYVWDFGVNPNAAANASALKPDTKHP